MKEECKPSFFPKIPKKGYFLNFFSYANIQDSFFLLYQNPSRNLMCLEIAVPQFYIYYWAYTVKRIRRCWMTSFQQRDSFQMTQDAHDVNATGKFPKKG